MALAMTALLVGCVMPPAPDGEIDPDLELARAAARAFCTEFQFPAEVIPALNEPPLMELVTLDRDGRDVRVYRWLGGGRGDMIVQVEIDQDSGEILVYGGYAHQEFGPWRFDGV